MPAGTGVCVVNTVPARTVASASSNVRPGLGAQLADALQAQVARVALVGVEHLGLRVPGDRAVRAHGAHPADADQDLLPDALVLVAAVEPVGDAAQVGVVLLDVGVEHQQRHPADRGLPDARLQQLPGGHRDLDEHLLARCPGRSVSGARFWPHEQLQRQPLRVEHRVGLQLPAVERQRLPEVPRPVQQPHPDERQAEVRGRLEVVAREHAEAARVVGQHLARRRTPSRSSRSPRAASGRPPARPGTSAAPRGTRRGRRRARGSVTTVSASAASSASLAVGISPSSRTGSWPARSQASGSSVANRSSVGGCQLHRRLVASVCSGASAGGSCARTVKRRRALTEEKGR